MSHSFLLVFGLEVPQLGST